MEPLARNRWILIALFRGLFCLSFGKVRCYLRLRKKFTIFKQNSLLFSQHFQRFPDIGLYDRLFGETAFKDLPIIHIRVSKNNTIVAATDSKGKLMAINSCGKEGYKNCRKGTNIAGQATAITLGKVNFHICKQIDKFQLIDGFFCLQLALQKGIHTVRIVVQGLGPGRASSVKGLQMAGLNIVSITDATRVSDHPPRARKARRI